MTVTGTVAASVGVIFVVIEAVGGAVPAVVGTVLEAVFAVWAAVAIQRAAAGMAVAAGVVVVAAVAVVAFVAVVAPLPVPVPVPVPGSVRLTVSGKTATVAGAEHVTVTAGATHPDSELLSPFAGAAAWVADAICLIAPSLRTFVGLGVAHLVLPSVFAVGAEGLAVTGLSWVGAQAVAVSLKSPAPLAAEAVHWIQQLHAIGCCARVVVGVQEGDQVAAHIHVVPEYGLG